MCDANHSRILADATDAREARVVGLFKQIKQLKSAEEAAPEPVDNRSDFEAIAGVTLELYAEIIRSLADTNNDLELAVLVAAKGISVANWDAAVEEWNARILANPAVGRQFNAFLSSRDVPLEAEPG
jgi:hypothetical protein